MKETDNMNDPKCPLVPAALLRSFKLRVPTVQVPSRTGLPPAVSDTVLSKPAQIRSLKLQKQQGMNEA